MKKTYYGDREKCYECFRPKSSCMCAYFQKISTQTKFVILMHPKEFKKTKNNTGFFTHRSLLNSELFVGIDFTCNERINQIIDTHESYVLFPAKESLNLTYEKPSLSNKPMAIFLIDSTWACTKSIFYHSKNLQTLPKMSFTTDKRSRYEIKTQPNEYCLSTMESTHVVLELLVHYKIEAIEQSQLDTFLRPFFEMISYQKELIANPKHNAVRFYKKR